MAGPQTAISITGAEGVMRLVGRLPDHLFGAAKDSFRVATLETQEAVLRRLRGNPMQSRSGGLARSIIPEVKGADLKTLRATVYSTSGYARIHELGGTVNARDKYRWLPGGPYLNIPTPANKTRAGVMRMSSTDVFRGGGKVMVGPEGFGLYLNGAKMFSFAKRVKIKAQLEMLKSGERQVPTLLSELRALLLRGPDLQ